MAIVDYYSYVFAVSFLEGVHVDFEQQIEWMKFENTSDYEIYLKRLEALPKRVSM